MEIYTIGFTKKSAKDFFSKLFINEVKTVIDIRLNNTSQLAGYAKKEDLAYFLWEIGKVRYVHKTELAPSEEILKDYKSKKIGWKDYEKKYIELLNNRKILEKININDFDQACLLCSESMPEQCHRKLLADYLSSNFDDVKIKHL